jgi:hypothetical protein
MTNRKKGKTKAAYVVYHIQGRIKRVRALKVLVGAVGARRPIATRRSWINRLRARAQNALLRLANELNRQQKIREIIEAAHARIGASAWFGDTGVIDTFLPHLSWTTLDRYLIAMDVLTPHMLYATALGRVDNEALEALLYPTDLILYKKPSVKRLAAQMMGFYTAFAKNYQHEPQLSLLGHAFATPGKYYVRFSDWDLAIDVIGAKLRTKEWFDVALPPARNDVLNDAYYQWLYLREVLALNYENLVPNTLSLMTQDELQVLSDVVREQLSDFPECRVRKLMRLDDKYFYFGLAYSRRVYPSLGTSVEIPVFVSERSQQTPLPALTYRQKTIMEMVLDAKSKRKVKYTSLTVGPRPGPVIDVVLFPSLSDNKSNYAPLVLMATRKPWALSAASVRRLPRGSTITVPPMGDADHPEWRMPLLLLAFTKPYVTSVAALLLQKYGERRITKEMAAKALKKAVFSRVMLSGLDFPRPPTERFNQLVTPLQPSDIFGDFLSDRANVMSEYYYGYQRNLAKIRNAVIRQPFVRRSFEKSKEKAKSHILGQMYTIASDRRRNSDRPGGSAHLFDTLNLVATAGTSPLVADEASLDEMEGVEQYLILMTDKPLMEGANVPGDQPIMRTEFIDRALASGVPFVTMQYKMVYYDTTGLDGIDDRYGED